MSDRSLARLEARFEKEDRLRMEEAMKRISGDSDLRFFARWLLETCGYGAAPASSDPLTMARDCGRLAVAEALVAEMNHTLPALYPALIKETTDERHARNAEFDARSRSHNEYD